MKKISAERQKRLNALHNKRWIKESRRRTKRKKRRRSGFKRQVIQPKDYINKQEVENKRKKIERKKGVEIKAPNNLDLLGNSEETISFVKNIRKVALEEEKPVHLILDDVKSLHPSAMLIIVSEIYRCLVNKISPGVITGTYPSDEGVEKVFQATGFFQLLKIKQRLLKTPKTYPLEYIRVITDKEVLGKKWYELIGAIFGAAIDVNLMPKERFYTALTEAMTNVSHHAYPSDADFKYPVLEGQWWLLGHVNKETKEFVVMFFDQGIGIPSSITKKHDQTTIDNILKFLSFSGDLDEQMIQVAMDLGQSVTSQKHRGKGLQEIRNLIDDCGAGSLNILSGKGRYQYTKSKTTIESIDTDLGGTFIQWEIPLNLISDEIKI